MRQFGPNLRAAPFSQSRKHVIAVPGFYRPRQHQTPESMKRGSVGNRGDGDNNAPTSNQTKPPYLPPQGNQESGKVRQGNDVTVTLEENQHSMQSVTCNKSPIPVKYNAAISGKNIDPIPLNLQSTDLHLNEIDKALIEVESGNNSVYIEDPLTLFFTESRPYTLVENNHALSDPKGNVSAAFNSKLLPELNTLEAKTHARASHSPRVSTLASKSRWTKVSRALPIPTEAASQGNLNYGKRPLTLTDDQSKLPNKRCLVSRSDEDEYEKLAEADIQPRQSP